MEQVRINAPTVSPPVGVSDAPPPPEGFRGLPPGAQNALAQQGEGTPEGLPPLVIPEGMEPPPEGQQFPQQDPNAGERPMSPEQFDMSKMQQEDIPAQFRNMTPAQMERRRAEEMSKAREPQQQGFAPSSMPGQPPRGGGGTGGGSGGGGGGY